MLPDRTTIKQLPAREANRVPTPIRGFNSRREKAIMDVQENAPDRVHAPWRGENIGQQTHTDTIDFPRGPMERIHRKILRSILFIFLLAGLGNCAPARPVPVVTDLEPAPASEPDLVPVRKKGPDGTYMKGPEAFCKVEGSKLKISLRNMGPPTSQSSTTSVVLFSRGEYRRYHIDTPPVGEKVVDLALNLPEDACFDRCVFTIIVDSRNSIAEGSGEKNNTVDGLCMG